jgi:cytochrome c oxidase cbb3-type subunit 2
MNIHTSHRMILLIPAVIYLGLVYVCAVWPAMTQQEIEARIERPFVDPLVERGFQVYRSYNCVTCHTQQVRGDARKPVLLGGEEVIPVLNPDARFGREVPTRAEEYAHLEPPLMGTQRTGPDLSSVGKRLPEAQWHYWHLYNPRSVSPDSVMPPYRFLFTTTRPSGDAGLDYEQVYRIESLGVDAKELWATPDAIALVEYLLSLNREGIESDEGP